MKTPAIAIALLVGASVALTGCGSESAPSASSLVGTWTAEQVGYGNGVLEGPYRSTFVITKADDGSNSFTGQRRVTAADAKTFGIPTSNARIDGVVTSWGEISIVHSDGTWTLEMEGDTMQGRYLETGSDLAAKKVTLTRQD